MSLDIEYRGCPRCDDAVIVLVRGADSRNPLHIKAICKGGCMDLHFNYHDLEQFPRIAPPPVHIANEDFARLLTGHRP